MSENTNTISAASEEFETFLPEGWAEGDNIFDVDSWTGGGDQADESDAGDEQEEVTEAEEGTEDETLTTGEDEAAEESGEDGDNAPTTEQETERPKLKFSAKIDHKVQDVELDETELPTIYRRRRTLTALVPSWTRCSPSLPRATDWPRSLATIRLMPCSTQLKTPTARGRSTG